MPEIPQCVHCGREVDLKSEPSMDGNHRRWWVHYPGGYTFCDPQRGVASAMAQGPEGWEQP